MKFFPFLCLFLSTASLMAQQPVIIEYAAVSNFHWGLFKGKINQRHIAEMGDDTGAVTVSSISYTALQTSPYSADITITARFHPDESWTRYPNLNKPEESLIHERRHLEITEIYARKLRRLVSNTRYTAGRFKDDLNRHFNEIASQQRAEQVKYDRETRHSLDAAQQEKWNARIDEQLKSLSAYTGTKVTIKLH